ncbi:MAG: hypothetical protein LBG74_08745 [Spirochaetaceae bacterium]|jgi:hypothetical protein|nr:hypothetical protein [Spirochaetaceae bacterium]
MDVCYLHFEHNGNPVLGFDTGLSSATFAKMRQSSLLACYGLIVRGTPGGGFCLLSEWKPEGVVERDGRMVVWGADFEGECIEPEQQTGSEQQAALIRLLLKARIFAEENYAPFRDGEEEFAPPAALIAKDGSVFFPPFELVRSVFRAQGEHVRLCAAGRWQHPDLRGAAAFHWTAAALLYAAYSGKAPFLLAPENTEETLHSDIRECRYLPLKYAAPHLDETAAAAIDKTLTVHEPLSESVWNAPLNQKPQVEIERIKKEGAAYFLKLNRRIMRRRFLRRNKGALLAAAAFVVIAAFFAGSFIQARYNAPSVKGLGPEMVVRMYYDALSVLDNAMIDACLAKGAAKDDRVFTANLYVIGKTREAYGGGGLEGFGITGLHISGDLEAAGDGILFATADYTLTMPAAENELPIAERRTDVLRLVWKKDRWQIAEIQRTVH